MRMISSPGWSEGPLKMVIHSSLSGERVTVFAVSEVTVRARSARGIRKGFTGNFRVMGLVRFTIGWL